MTSWTFDLLKQKLLEVETDDSIDPIHGFDFHGRLVLAADVVDAADYVDIDGLEVGFGLVASMTLNSSCLPWSFAS